MELKTLIAECTAYDFKVMLEEKKPKSWLKSVSAFANGFGGYLFFGIDNDGIVKGLDDVQHICEDLPVIVQVDRIPPANRPKSDTIDLLRSWMDDEDGFNAYTT